MFRRLARISILLISSSITCQAAPHIWILPNGTLGNVPCYRQGGSEIWTKPIAGGVEAILKVVENLDMQIGGMYFQPKQFQVWDAENVNITKTAFGMNIMSKARLRPYVEQMLSFDIGTDNFYGAVGIFTIIPSITRESTTIRHGFCSALLMGVGYQYHFNTHNMIDCQIDRIQSINAGLESTWICKIGLGLKLMS